VNNERPADAVDVGELLRISAIAGAPALVALQLYERGATLAEVYETFLASQAAREEKTVPEVRMRAKCSKSKRQRQKQL
jgi:hypothetical protein